MRSIKGSSTEKYRETSPAAMNLLQDRRIAGVVRCVVLIFLDGDGSEQEVIFSGEKSYYSLAA